MTTDPRFDGPGPIANWQARLSEGTFTIQYCRSCTGASFPPTTVCPHCGSPDTKLIPASGRGIVHSTTNIRKRDGAYNVSIVELTEGIRMMSRVEGDPEAVQIGQPVIARIATEHEKPLVVFDPEVWA